MSNTLTGSSIKIYGNGVLIGTATEISFTRTQGAQPIMEIDNPFPAEIRPTSYIVNGSIGGIRIRQVNSLDGSGLMDISSPDKFFTQSYVKLEIVDRGTDKALYSIDQVMFSNDTWAVSSKGVMSFRANFIGFFASVVS